MRFRKSYLAASILPLAIFLSACGSTFIRSLNAGFDQAPIVVGTLEANGAISGELATALRVDFPDGKQVANDLFNDLRAIPKDAPDRKAQQLSAWQRAEQRWLAIVNRGHFKLNPKTQKFVDVANGIFAAAIQAYGGISESIKAPAEDVRPNMTDEEIEQMLERKIEALRDCMN